MPDFILDYDDLETISNYSKSLGKCAEEYGEELDSQIVTAIANVTGVSTGHLTSARDSVKGKIKELKLKTEDFYNLADQISNLLEVAKQEDQEVADIINSQRKYSIEHHKSLQMDDLSQKLLKLFVNVKNKNSHLALLLDIINESDTVLTSFADYLKYYYKYERGKNKNIADRAVRNEVLADTHLALLLAAAMKGSSSNTYFYTGKKFELLMANASSKSSDLQSYGKSGSGYLRSTIKEGYKKTAIVVKEPEKAKGTVKTEKDVKDTSKLDETYVTKDQLQKIYNKTTVTDEMITDLNRVLAKYGITNIENIQHFIAQTCVETGYGNSVVEKGSDKYLNNKKYGKKYSGVGYIQMTWAYSYQAFATYLMLEKYPDLKKAATYKNPKNNSADAILKAYNKIVKEASNKGYSISTYTDIVDIGRDYVASNYAWETAGYYWSINGLTTADSSTPVDDVTKVVNRWTDSYDDREKAYEKVKKYIK